MQQMHQAVTVGCPSPPWRSPAEQAVLSERARLVAGPIQWDLRPCCRAALLEQALSNVLGFSGGWGGRCSTGWPRLRTTQFSVRKGLQTGCSRSSMLTTWYSCFPFLLVMLLSYFVILIHVCLHFSLSPPFFLFQTFQIYFYTQVLSYRLVAMTNLFFDESMEILNKLSH